MNRTACDIEAAPSEDELGQRIPTRAIRCPTRPDHCISLRSPGDALTPSPRVLRSHGPVCYTHITRTGYQALDPQPSKSKALRSHHNDDFIKEDATPNADSSDDESTSSHLSDQSNSIRHEIMLLGHASSQLQEHIGTVYAHSVSVEAAIEKALAMASKSLSAVLEGARDARALSEAQLKRQGDLASEIKTKQGQVEALEKGLVELLRKWQKYPALVEENRQFFDTTEAQREVKREELVQLTMQLKQLEIARSFHIKTQDKCKRKVKSAEEDVARYLERQTDMKAGILQLMEEHIMTIREMTGRGGRTKDEHTVEEDLQGKRIKTGSTKKRCHRST